MLLLHGSDLQIRINSVYAMVFGKLSFWYVQYLVSNWYNFNFILLKLLSTIYKSTETVVFNKFLVIHIILFLNWFIF